MKRFLPPNSLLSAALLALLLSACAQQGDVRGEPDTRGAVVTTPESQPVAADNAAAAAVPAVPTTEAAPPATNDMQANAAAKTTAPATAPSAAAETHAAAAPNMATASTAAQSADTDFASLYGSSNDASEAPVIAYDPWERYNRRVHALNNGLDRRLFKPVATVYSHTVPRPVRNSVGNFFRNLGGPTNTINALLQGKPSQAGGSLFRFLVNSTFGIGGLFDVATRMGIPDKSEDFGQTFAKWGWKKSRYVELPLFGPRTVRDVLGMLGDMKLNPLKKAQTGGGQIALQTAQVINVRAMLLSTDAMREGAQDDYTLFRDAWWQRRSYMIWGEDNEDKGGDLPDYLKDAVPAKKPE